MIGVVNAEQVTGLFTQLPQPYMPSSHTSGATFTQAICFQRNKGGSERPFALAVSQVPLIQNHMPTSYILGGHILNLLTTRLSSFLA